MTIAAPITGSDVRVWVYRSTQKLIPALQDDIQLAAESFVRSWQSHGQQLKAEFSILNDHYLVFFVDQNWAQNSGCSIDSSVGFVRELEGKYQLGLFDRMKIGFLINDVVKFYDYQSLSTHYANGEISDETKVINHLLDSADHFEDNWIIPFSESPFYVAVK